MNATLGVLESCLGVVERASLVRIDPSALEALAARLARGSFERPAWRKPSRWKARNARPRPPSSPRSSNR